MDCALALRGPAGCSRLLTAACDNWHVPAYILTANAPTVDVPQSAVQYLAAVQVEGGVPWERGGAPVSATGPRRIILSESHMDAHCSAPSNCGHIENVSILLSPSSNGPDAALHRFAAWTAQSPTPLFLAMDLGCYNRPLEWLRRLGTAVRFVIVPPTGLIPEQILNTLVAARCPWCRIVIDWDDHAATLIDAWRPAVTAANVKGDLE